MHYAVKKLTQTATNNWDINMEEKKQERTHNAQLFLLIL